MNFVLKIKLIPNVSYASASLVINDGTSGASRLGCARDE
jgi:hypothetical protein